MISKLSIKKTIRLFFTGFTMGAADIVPGVSGGTVAFLFGIYEELIQAIKTVSGEVLRLVLKFKIKEAIQTIPFVFLIPLGFGLMTALFTLSNGVSYLLQTYPEFLWSFFFGLIVASVLVVRKRVVTWNFHDYVAMVITAILVYFLVGIVPVETPDTYLALFLSGVVAICAMILPGISGSFLLVIMGKYEQILNAVATRDIVSLVVFASGAVVGLAIFSRVLSWLFKKHHDIVIAILTGFMIGSLRKVWPWKEVISTRINSHGDTVPVLERNIFPEQFGGDVMLSIVLILVGLLLVIILDKFQVTKEHVADIQDPQFESHHHKALKSQKSGTI